MIGAALLLAAQPRAASPDSLDLAQTLLVGALSSLVASLVFLLGLRLLRPRLALATQVAYNRNSEGQPVYRAKVVNKGFFTAVNIRIEVAELTTVAGYGGTKETKKRLSTRPLELFALPRNVLREPRLNPPAHYAFRFTIEAPLQDIVHIATSRVRIRLYAEHPVSRVVRTFEQTISGPGQIVHGDYMIGKSLAIQEEPDGGTGPAPASLPAPPPATPSPV